MVLNPETGTSVARPYEADLHPAARKNIAMNRNSDARLTGDDGVTDFFVCSVCKQSHEGPR
jgi:hypothetical protein